jgi:hypothetical protein
VAGKYGGRMQVKQRSRKWYKALHTCRGTSVKGRREGGCCNEH